jgi:hypothetical protein
MSLIFSATLAFEAVGANVAQGTARVNPVICSFPRREETIRDAEDSVLDSVPPSGLDRLDRGKKELTRFISVLLS